MKIKSFLLLSLAILSSIIFAFVVRSNYTNKSAEIYNYEISPGSFQSNEKNGNSYTEKDILDKSELIVEATFRGERKIAYTGFYSNVTIQNVYKGNKDFIGKSIYIVEPLRIFTWTKFINTSAKLYLPLQNNKAYLLFLKKVQFSPERNQNQMQQIEYYLTTEDLLSSYKITSNKQTQLLEDGKLYSLNTLNDFEIPAYNSSDLNLYYQTKNQLFNSLKIPYNPK